MKNFTRYLICLALLSPLPFQGCQPEEHSFSSTSCPIFGGEPDTKPEHMAVVYLQMVSGQWAAGCTGTLIGPRIVLTAAHCVLNYEPENVTVYFGNTTTSAQVRRVSEVKWHPDYNRRYYNNDIAMVRLESDPPAGIAPIPFLPHSMGITDADIGRPLEFVGFGQTETGAFGTKMTVINNLNWICVAGDCDFMGGAINTICQDQVPGGPCQGDSGGPALVKRAGLEYVCGVTSYGDEECLQFGCSTKVDEFEEFIRTFAGDLPGTPCTENWDCISNACVDYVCCENACAGRCESCNQPGLEGQCVQVPDGTPCPDSDVCNGEETCSEGSCQRGEPLVCQDAIECTFDTCDPNTGCDFQPLAADCDDQEACTRDRCDPDTGCVHEPLEDGLECAKDMTCVSGVCQKKPKAGGCSTGAGGGAGSGGSLALFLLFLLILTARRVSDRAA